MIMPNIKLKLLDVPPKRNVFFLL